MKAQVVCLLVLGLASSALGRTVIIDNFEDPGSVAQLYVDIGAGDDMDLDTGLDTANVVGGARYAVLDAWNLNPLDADQFLAMDINTNSSGVCHLSSRLTSGEAVAALTYGSQAASHSSLDENWSDLTHVLLDFAGGRRFAV